MIKITNHSYREKKKKKKILNQLQKNQNIGIVINVFLESQLSASFPPLWAMAHLCFPRRPSSTGWGWGAGLSGPTVVTAEPILALLLSVLASSFTASRARAFSFVGTLIVLLYIPQNQSLPSWSYGFNLQRLQLVERFLVLFLSHSTPGAQLWFYPHHCMWVIHGSLLLKLSWRIWDCPSVQRAWRWCGCLNHRAPVSAKFAGKLIAMGVGDTAVLGLFPSLW